MEISEMIEKLNDYLPEKRKRHSLNVAKSAVRLCEFRGCDKKKAEIAGILHDTAKYVKFADVDKYCKKYGIELDDLEKKSTALSHSVLGSYIAKYEFGIDDEEILGAIRYHTTGKPDMSPLEEVIYLADLIEEGRDYPGVDDLRKMAYSGEIDKAIVKSIDNTITLVLKKKAPLHTRTVEARNYYIQKIKSMEKE
ncbi:HD domain-containing protein [Peptostreptococcus russellii]|uniref:bis(5'-nucleosyl)-tetraphosphatase (symmetrical) YqeK n=1 Tax=Peptostreptococcus russellii TaxID=215200 RepID=UPI00162925F1|nr:bis(5'-nucleosyl)-tetraphosphatase (symmetrical) YqeK [Peptostreptococcus russellii]MBC2577159.1 HD domain-containing protein [Peptostreptococcus russellii]